MDDKAIPNKTVCTFSFYLDESEILHCVVSTEDGKQTELTKRIFVDSNSLHKTAFFSCCEEVETATNALAEMVGMDLTDVHQYTKKLWEVKQSLEEKEIESSVTERSVYNCMDDRRFKAVHKRIGTLRNQVDDLVIRYHDQTAFGTIRSTFEGFKNRLDRNKGEFLPEMHTWIECVEWLDERWVIYL